MDYEKKYKEALAHAREIHRNEAEKRRDMEWLFPELKESDERIRKVLIDYFKEQEECAIKTFYGIPIDNILAWLKKQGEQKPFDYENANIQQKDFAPKVEPKFKVGDYIKHNKANIIYYVKNIETNGGIQELFNAEQNFHLWTIEDAKEGDVLYSPCLSLLWIFKSRDTVYCGYNLNYNDGAFCEEGYLERPTDAIPATKEQRDLLFAKIKEAGYEWDAEEKELKKSQRMISAEAKEALYDKPAWSKMDEDTLESLISLLQDYGSPFEGAVIDWLKSLKQRIGG